MTGSVCSVETAISLYIIVDVGITFIGGMILLVSATLCNVLQWTGQSSLATVSSLQLSNWEWGGPCNLWLNDSWTDSNSWTWDL